MQSLVCKRLILALLVAFQPEAEAPVFLPVRGQTAYDCGRAVAAAVPFLEMKKLEMLLAFSRAVDRFNEKIAVFADWLVLLSCLISAGNAFSRYSFSLSSNAWLEIQWYMFGAMILLGASYTLKKNEHVRVDIIYGHLSTRTQIWIDIIGGVLFLLPATVIIGWMAWPMFHNSFVQGEVSSNAGGLLRWPIKLMIPRNAMKPNGAPITSSDTSAAPTPYGIAANTTSGLTALFSCTTSARKMPKIDTASTTLNCPKPFLRSSCSPAIVSR